MAVHDPQDPAYQLALLRYKLIAPLLDIGAGSTLKAAIDSRAKHEWTLPDGDLRIFSASTIEKYLYRYRKDGLEGLFDTRRKDINTLPSITAAVAEGMDECLKAYLTLPASLLIDKLRARPDIADALPSTATIYRYLSARRPTAPAAEDRRAFACSTANALWQVDIKYGPNVPCKTASGKWRDTPTYLKPSSTTTRACSATVSFFTIRPW